ncbi:MAG: serine/threonine-protein kinase [bacterium]
MTELSSAPPPEEGTVEFGDYLIHELIGAGGMAEVFRADRKRGADEDAQEAAPVVIKRVKPSHADDPGFIQMFVDEAKLSAQLNHPNIVSVYEYGEAQGHHFIAMEYIDGLHLQGLHVRHVQRLKQPLPWQAGVIIVRDVLRGLDYAHRKVDEQGRPMGLIHRDINLVNIMVGRDGKVKVLDFGIVKAADGIRSAETVGAVLKGKFGYMSPEQAEGRRLDSRSDVFSASIVLHELLTGRRLFWGKDDLEILRKVRHGDILDPRQFAPEVPEDLVRVVNRGLARDLAGRYQSAGEMAEALDGIIAAHDVSDSVLSELMLSLLGPKPSAASDRMKRRRKKLTLLAWQQGVRERESVRLRPVSGVLGGADVEQTSAGKTASRLDELELENDTLITTDMRWMAPEQVGEDVEPVLSEQDQAAAEEFAEALRGDKTQILEEDELPPDVAAPATPSRADDQTEILDSERHQDIALSDQKTELLGAEGRVEGETAAPRVERAGSSPPTVAELNERADRARRRRLRMLLAIAAALAVVVGFFVLLKIT